MKWLGRLGGGLIFSFVAGACTTGRVSAPRAPQMVRSYGGTLIPGHYVSPSAYRHYVLAQLHANAGRSEAAVDELRQALASDGASPYLRARLSEELLALGRVDEAREEAEAALELDPHFPEGYVGLARVRLRVGDVASAEAALKRAIEVDRTCEDAYLTLARIYRDRGQDQKLFAVWRDLVKHVPNSATGHHALGRAALVRGDVRAAERSLRRAVELEPGAIDARVALAELYQGEGRLADAVAQLDAAWLRSGDLGVAERLVRMQMAAGHAREARELIERLDEEGGSPERRRRVAGLRIFAKQPERALEIAEELLQAGEAPAHRLLAARALKALQRPDDALQHLRHVPAGAPEFSEAQRQIAELLRDAGRYREAIEVVGKALTILAVGDGDARDVLYRALAEIHERAGARAEAIKLLEDASKRRPGSSTLAFALAATLERDGQWQRAVDVAERILRRDPESVPALNFIGFLLADRGVRLDDAQKLLERALAMRPNDGAIVDSLGWLHFRLGRLDEAERLLLRADRLAPEDPEILGHLGQLYVKKADRARAIDAYKRALSHNPEERVRRLVEEQILLLETGRVGSR